MAGTAKPSNVNAEITDYTLGAFSTRNSRIYSAIKPSNLFNQSITGAWTTGFDWNYSGDYMTITINKKCNIWRYNGADVTQNKALSITPATFKQQNTLTTAKGWQLWVEELEPGTYTFAYKSGYRGDFEWYLESVENPSAMIKAKVLERINNNKYFQHCVKYKIEEE